MGLRDKIREFYLDKSGIRAILESQNLQNRMAQESLAAITFSNAIQNSEWLKYKILPKHSASSLMTATALANRKPLQKWKKN